MISVSKIYEAWLADVIAELKLPLGLLTIDSYEGSFDAKTLQQMIALSPFALLQCVNNRSKKRTSNKTAEYEQSFNWVVGSQNLLSKKTAKTGVQNILDAMHERYDGFELTIDGKVARLLWDNEVPVWSDDGLIVYQQNYFITNI